MSRTPQRQRKLREKARRPRLRLVKNKLPPAEIPAIAAFFVGLDSAVVRGMYGARKF